MKNVICTVLFTAALFFLIVTVSIGLPIYCRSFYYAQIEPLDIPASTGKTVTEIKEGYDEVLDYLTLPGREFGTGSFEYSEEGRAHFVDCKVLFDLNATVLLVSLAAVVALLVLHFTGCVRLCRPLGLPPSFFSGVTTFAVFGALGAVVALDFDKAFTAFHKLFFPGKTNWVFDWRTDEIILALPQQFFMNCAILIASSVILLSLFCIVGGIFRRKKY